MSSVKAIFPSISMKRKPKTSQQPGSTSSQLTATSTTPSQFFRPLTPEAPRKVVSGDSVFESKALDGHLNANSSINSKENDGETIERSHSPLQQPFAEPKVVSRSPRPQSRSSYHRESLTSVHDRTGSLNSENSGYSDLIEAPMVEQEDIIALTYHVRAFSEALGSLRNTFFEESESPDDKPPEVKAHERLGEVLSILKGVIKQYQPLHSTDILAAAGTLINKVRGHNYDESDQPPEEFCESIDQLALAFSSSVSDFLMGDQDIPLSASRENSRSLEDFADDDEDDEMEDDEADDMDDDQDDDDYGDDRRRFDKKETSVDKSAQKADELDKTLFGLEHGVDLTLQRTKVWSKYAKDIATYLERRAHLELEFTNKLAKLAQATRASITEDRYLPFQSIYVTSLDQDIDYAENCARTYNSLLSSKFLEPLQNRRSSHEKKRKDLKELWTKAYKKLNEAIVKLEKAKQTYIQKQHEIEKFKSVTDAKDGQDFSTSSTRTQKKKHDDVRKADEAEEWYKQCVAEANVRQRELLKTKSHVLVELRQLIYQCDQTMKAVTCNFFQLMHSQSVPTPIRFECLAETSRTYEPGCQFADFVYDQQLSAQPSVEREFIFEPLTSSHSPVKAWSPALQDHMSDADSTGNNSAPVTPDGSPVMRPKIRLQFQATITEDSSDDESTTEVEKPEVRPTKTKSRDGSGPFQNCRMSTAAQTHKFKKLRAPSRCRDCDSYVYFNGAECAVCALTCHRKCLARIKIRCDKKRGTGNRSSDYNGGRRMTTFGVDFYSHLQATHKEDVPYIVSSCVEEVNSRGLDIKGIYRVSGVKSKVEKVCQAFENNSGTVNLSHIPPHVIAAVLKLYLRQLPEPLLTFNLYPEFIKIGKESLDVTNDDVNSNEYKEVLCKLREVVVKLPRAHFKTAAKIINHLKLIANNEEENQMSACNLGIVFGPTLLKPRESATTDSISMSALVEMPHQTKAVELLIKNPQVFDAPGVDDPASQQTPVEEFERDKSESIPMDVCSVRKRDSKTSLTESLSATENGSTETPHDETVDVNPNQIETEKRVQPVHPDQSDNHDTDIINNKIISNSAPTPPNSSVSSIASSPSKSLGFDNGFLDLLTKSNNRTENDKDQEYRLPEFLLPGSTDEQDENDKDGEDSYDDSIQGTSGFCTPDDDLGSSRGSITRDDEPTEPASPTQTQSFSALSSSRSMPDIAGISRSSSNYSITTSVSFGSELPDEKLLPDCSEATDSAPKLPEIPLENPSGYFRPYPKKTVDDSSVPSRTRSRPNSFGLFKRHSDLHGMMSRIAFLSSGSKSSGNDTDESKKSPRTTEEVLLNSASSQQKRQGVTEALRKMHVVYDPILQHGDQQKQTNGDVKAAPSAVVKETQNDLKTPHESRTEPARSSEWYVSEQDHIHEMDNQENTIDFEPTENQQTSKVDGADATGNPVRNLYESEPEEQKQNSFVSEFEGPRDKAVEQQKRLVDHDSRDIEAPRGKEEVDVSGKEKELLCSKDTPTSKIGDENNSMTPNETNTKCELQEKSRTSQRVSVKDRRRQYEKTPDTNDQSSEPSESSRKPQSSVGKLDIASRKQVFESTEKGTKKDTYKALSDISRQAKSSSQDSSREELYEIGKDSPSPRLNSDRLDHSLQENVSEKLEAKEPTQLWSRRVDILLDETTTPQHNEESQNIHLRTTNSFPLTRTSPKPSRRPRRQFPEDKTQEDREPQFV